MDDRKYLRRMKELREDHDYGQKQEIGKSVV